MDIDIYIPLVNDRDQITDFEEKLLVHQQGLLHRAFSILVYNTAGNLLIHQRALSKYHTPGLWTNTCCGHPNKGEEMETAVHRRLEEEMGFDCDLNYSFTFRYRAEFANGLIENEIDHVYVGTFDGDFTVNPDEVADFKWLSKEEIKSQINASPEKFTAWFKEIVNHEKF